MIDAHAHLTDDRFAGEVDEVLARARTAGVDTVVTIGTDLPDSGAAVALAARHEGLFATVGIHPHEARHASAEALAEIAALASSPAVVAIGETGLDYHYDHSPRDAQRSAFVRQIEMAAELDLPVVVHSRDADGDVEAILREHGSRVRGVLHSFASGATVLDAGLDAGWFISFSGMVTFRSYDAAELVRAVPGDRLLVETDSPYLTPVPHRGTRNEPAHVTLVAARLAELRGEDPAALANACARNTRELYRLPSHAT